jgi:nucleotide-binding universal stress UspA family protein
MPGAKLAYLPLITYPDTVSDASVATAVRLALSLDCELHVTTFSARIPRVSTPLGALLLDVPGMIRVTEENSRNQCQHLQELVLSCAGRSAKVGCHSRETVPGLTGDAAATEARYFDLSLVPWAEDKPVLQDLAQAVVFGSGRPTVLVPPSGDWAPITHIAVAWDGSRVAARALADAMMLIGPETRVTVVTVENEKQLERQDIAETLADSLKRRGLSATALSVPLGGRPIGEVLQASALEAGADLLVMGGFGHSRIRDFVLGGATKGILAGLRMPVLISH